MQVQNTKSFLVVDDEPLVRMDMAELIRENGYEAWEAANASEALGILERAGDAFIGLITDVNMPGTRNGMVLANHVRAIWPHIRIIVVSAGRKPFAGELPDNASFIHKPWRPEQVVTAIGAV
ncbi:response regulator [Devosia aurantiaca]|uniref:Response regulator n=1 Tax=Devosia aurantiaca TaxID=2714858 RepID=A0A6M1SME3_9HYPH|nr:response regulator [Devosia aurantiaca]NGP18300.1 response regulator [Devosia aurantiaca]